jgi:hypothetical protein
VKLSADEQKLQANAKQRVFDPRAELSKTSVIE